MRRRLLIAGLVLTAFVVGLCVHSYGVPGRTANGGIGISTPWFNVGIEVWGHPGFFNCSDTGC